jgi:hypothetical protein
MEEDTSEGARENKGISQARRRLGWEPMKELYDKTVKPIATEKTKGAWYKGLR